MTVNRLEGGIFTVMVISVVDPYDPALEAAIGKQVGANPGFFAEAPVVLDLSACLGCTSAADFVAIKAVLRRYRLVAVGVQGASAPQQRAAAAADLAVFPGASGRSRGRGEPAKAQTTRTRLVTQPVRSGTQIYAKGGDLVVAAPVSAGAELIADGNVHVYGALRGRAIAGACGDKDARIFVQRLEAELLCVAGRYIVSEAIAPEHLRQPVQVALVDDQLRILPGF